MLPPICILAGGLGTRLGEVTKDVPKPLIRVAGEPFLCHQLRLVARYGAEEIVLCVGHLGEQIEEAIGHSREGLRIAYSYDAPGLDGTLGAIRRASPLLGERFLVLYGDTYLQVDYAAFAHAWEQSSLPAAMTVLRNENRWGPSNAAYEAGRVLRYDKSNPSLDMAWIDYGLGGLTAGALDLAQPSERDLAELYHRLAQQSLLFGFEAANRFHDIGSPEAWEETDRFLRSLA